MEYTLIDTSAPKNFKDLKKLPILKSENSEVIRFQAHHVIPVNQFGKAKGFFDALNKADLWNPNSFAQNGIAMPTSEDIGPAVHSGSHPSYSKFIQRITTSFARKYKEGDFGGKTESEWLEESAKKLDGLVAHLRYELAHPDSDYHLKRGDRPDVDTKVFWSSLAAEWDTDNLEFNADSTIAKSSLYQSSKVLEDYTVRLDTSAWSTLSIGGERVDVRDLGKSHIGLKVEVLSSEKIATKMEMQKKVLDALMASPDRPVDETIKTLDWLEEGGSERPGNFKVVLKGLGKAVPVVGDLLLGMTTVEAAELKEQGDVAGANGVWVKYAMGGRRGRWRCDRRLRFVPRPVGRCPHCVGWWVRRI